MGRINCLEGIFPQVTHSTGICNLEALVKDLGLTFLVQRVNKHKMWSMKTIAKLKTKQL